ncbi:MAG: helix-turn-helix transcriptional regulator [Gammaproteobacteria bacterium]
MAKLIDDELVGLLADGTRRTGREIAQELGVSLRTVRRAIARLRCDDVVLDTEPGRGGGVGLGHHSALPRLRLTPEESLDLLLALALAESLTLPLLGANLGSLRRRLSAVFHPDDRRAVNRFRKRILVGNQASDEVRTSWSAPARADMATLQSGFVSMQRVGFRYRDGHGSQTHRVAEPQYLLLNHPAWYLLGYDMDRQAGRMFRLDRMSAVRVHLEPFRPRDSVALADDLALWFKPL